MIWFKVLSNFVSVLFVFYEHVRSYVAFHGLDFFISIIGNSCEFSSVDYIRGKNLQNTFSVKPTLKFVLATPWIRSPFLGRVEHIRVNSLRIITIWC